MGIMAQETKDRENHYFKSVHFSQPFVADLENRAMDIEMHYSSNYPSYDLSNSGKEYKFFQTINLGADLPIYSKTVKADRTPLYSFAISLPIAFNLWWDPLEETTSPVLNTSYKCGLINLKYIRYFNSGKIRNVSFRLAPYNHESTHIGDELALYTNSKGNSISRINVSYAFSEFNFTINDPEGNLDKCNSFRFGLKYRINGVEGFYTANVPANDSILIPPSGPNAELYLQYNLIRGKGFLSSEKFVNIISMEVRSNIRYNYDETRPIDASYFRSENYQDQHALCFNVYAGWKFKNGEYTGLGMYLHGYSGINPYGQFRNHANYKCIGLSFIWN